MYWVTFSHACMAFTPVPMFVVILVEDAFLVGGRAKGLERKKQCMLRGRLDRTLKNPAFGWIYF